MAERIAALLFLVASGGYLALSLPLPRGVAARPGAGFFPLLVGAFLCLVAAVFVVIAFRRPRATATQGSTGRLAGGPDGVGPPVGGAGGRVISTAVALVGFCLLLPWAGFLLATFGFVTVLLKRLGGGGWTPALVIGALSAAGAWYLFAVLLAVPLPRGLWLD